MKSKKAQEFIKSETYHHVGFEAWTADILHISDAEKAVELAETEMRERAIEAYRKSCVQFSFTTDTCEIDFILCERKRCARIKLFTENFDNPKTEQI